MLPKIHPENQVVLSDQLITDTVRDYGIDPVVSASEVPFGISSTVVEVEDDKGDLFYLKYYRTTHERTQVENELLFAGRLALFDLPIPEYVSPGSPTALHDSTSEHGSHFTTLTRKMPGSHLDTYTPAVLEQLGAAHGMIHSIFIGRVDHSDFDPTKNYNFYQPAPREKDVTELDVYARSFLDRMKGEWDKLPGGLVPMDIKRDNVLVQDDNLTGIIDFADVAPAPAAFCLAGTLWDVLESSSGSFEDMKSYLEAYERSRQLSDSEQSLLLPLMVIRGWITLHGTLLTQGRSRTQQSQAELLDACLQRVSDQYAPAA